MEQNRNNGDYRRRTTSSDFRQRSSNSMQRTSSSNRERMSRPSSNRVTSNRSSINRASSTRPSSSRRTSSGYFDDLDDLDLDSLRKNAKARNYHSSASKGNDKKSNKKGGNGIKAFFKGASLVLLILLFAVIGIGMGAYFGIIKSSPELELIAIEPNVYTSIIYDKDGNEIDRFHGDENREYVTLDKIPVYLQNAIVSIEDERFYSHNGIDYKGIARAAYVTIKSKLGGSTRTEGASTITQQLIKNNVTKVSRNNAKTKIQEQYLAVKYEKELTKQLGSKKAAKDYILELYLNTIGLNHGYNGVQAAAKGYFNKDVEELDLAESACIAGITNNPTYYTPRNHPDNNKERQQRILSNMLEQGYINKTEYEEAVNEDIYSRVSDSSVSQDDTGSVVHSYFVDGLFEQISSDLQQQYKISAAQANNILYNSGLQIYSTLDQDIQKIVDDTYLDDSLFPNVSYGIDVSYTVSVEEGSTGKQNHTEYKQFVKNKAAADSFVADKKAEIMASLGSGDKIIADKAVYNVEPQSAMVIMDYRTGEVKALTGGRGDKVVNRGFNRAMDSTRQPGSVFKVLAAFAPGIDTGKLTAATVFDDVPYTVGDYSPKNWYSNPPYRGLSTIRDAVRDSMNIIAVKSMVHTGIQQCYDYLLNFGFTTLENDDHAATALGGLTKGVTQLEVTAAYGAIANGGAYNRPMLYSKVLDHDGNVLLENNQESKQVLKKTSAFILTDMMTDVIKSGTGTAAKFRNSSMPIAGKTGTTQESRDLTFVGYTPYYVAGIWLGYDRYDDTVKNMANINQSSHLVVWRTIMEKIHQNLEVKKFEKPEGIVTAQICTESGKLAGKLCSSDPRGTIKTEYFAEGTQPTDYCNVHKAVSVCKDSYMSPSKYCPASSIITSVGIVRPEPYKGDAVIGDRKYEVGHLGVCNVHSAGSASSAEENADNQEGNAEENNQEENGGSENAGGQSEKPAETTTKEQVSLGEIVPSTPSDNSTPSSLAHQGSSSGSSTATTPPQPSQPVMPE